MKTAIEGDARSANGTAVPEPKMIISICLILDSSCCMRLSNKMLAFPNFFKIYLEFNCMCKKIQHHFPQPSYHGSMV
jgi:hypothetical protein